MLELRIQVLTHLEDAINSRPETLGDARNESAEELAERHGRVMAAALLALASFAQLMVTAKAAPGATPGTAALAAASLQRLRCIWEKQGFFKLVLTYKQAAVRRAAYAALSQLAKW